MESVAGSVVNKEDMFFWIDVLSLKKDDEVKWSFVILINYQEFNKKVEEIHKTYFPSQLNIPKELEDKLSKPDIKGQSLYDIFKEAADYIFQKALSLDLIKDKMRLFSQAIMYKYVNYF